MAKKIPDGFYTLTPYLRVKGAAAAIEFYAKAFGAAEVYRLPGPGGSVMHAELTIGSSRLMLSEEYKDWGSLSPLTLGGTAVSIHVYIEDVDAAFTRAVDAGCKVKMAVQLMPWGDRFAAITDPYGHEWTMATHVEDVAPEEIVRRMSNVPKKENDCPAA